MSIVGLRRTCKRLNVKCGLADAAATRRRRRRRRRQRQSQRCRWHLSILVAWRLLHSCLHLRLQQLHRGLKNALRLNVDLSSCRHLAAFFMPLPRIYCHSESSTITISTSLKLKTRTERWHATANTSHLTQLLYTVLLFVFCWSCWFALATR